MYKIMNDKKYRQIADPIIDHPEYKKLKRESHHLMCTRYDHCLSVSHYTYHLAKMLKMDVESATRAALLHDFFRNPKSGHGTKSLFTHGELALKNARKHFDVNEKEANIIASHMFPTCAKAPLYKESWLVTLVDKFVSIMEYAHKLNPVAITCMLVLIRL